MDTFFQATIQLPIVLFAFPQWLMLSSTFSLGYWSGCKKAIWESPKAGSHGERFRVSKHAAYLETRMPSSLPGFSKGGKSFILLKNRDHFCLSYSTMPKTQEALNKHLWRCWTHFIVSTNGHWCQFNANGNPQIGVLCKTKLYSGMRVGRMAAR